MLSIDKDYPKVQAIVKKYGERHSELKAIKPHPMLMLQRTHRHHYQIWNCA
jgi:hypothetical protein